jgi:phospholipid/cholesterol/gamma-HCH transport system permease protein
MAVPTPRFTPGSPQLLVQALFGLAAFRREPVRRVWMKQVYFCGIEALWPIALLAIAVGGIIVGQLHYQYGQSGSGAVQVLATLSLTELAPLFTAIVLTARSSSAMASELALMRLHGELTALARMGIDPIRYLVVPRIWAMALACGVLSVYFMAFTLVTGLVGVAGLRWLDELQRLMLVLPLSAPLLGVLKGMLFGTSMAAVACAGGLASGRSATEVPVAASNAVIRCLLAIFLADAALNLGTHL